jgi:hypothetical protein
VALYYMYNRDIALGREARLSVRLTASLSSAQRRDVVAN